MTTSQICQNVWSHTLRDFSDHPAPLERLLIGSLIQFRSDSFASEIQDFARLREPSLKLRDRDRKQVFINSKFETLSSENFEMVVQIKLITENDRKWHGG